MKALVLARFTFREAVRKRIVVASVILGSVFLALFTVGTHFAVRELETSRLLVPSFRIVVVGQLLLSGIWVVSLAGSLLAIFAGCGALSAEIENHTLQSIASKPIERWEIVVGKWLGLALMVAAYTAVAAVVVIGVVWLRAGYLPPNPLAAALALSLQSLVLLSMTLLASALFSSLATGIGVFMLHAIAMAGGLEEQIGFVLQNRTMQEIGLWVSLVIPTDVLAKLAASWLQPNSPLTSQMPNPFGALLPPTPWMAAYAGLYLLVCLLLAVARINRADL